MQGLTKQQKDEKQRLLQELYKQGELCNKEIEIFNQKLAEILLPVQEALEKYNGLIQDAQCRIKNGIARHGCCTRVTSCEQRDRDQCRDHQEKC